MSQSDKRPVRARLVRRIGLANNRRGSVAIIVAAFMFTAVAFGAVSVDVGFASYMRRRLQAATDVAAAAAIVPLLQSQVAGQAPDVSRIQAIALAALAGNDEASASISSLVFGTYCPNPAIPAASRFVAGSAGCSDGSYVGPTPNAVKLAVNRTIPLYLAQIFGNSTVGVAVTSIAVGVNEGSFTMGTGLVSVDTSTSPVLNAVLSGFLGTSVNLSAVSYQGLANVDIDAHSYLAALAGNASPQVNTYDALGSVSVTAPQSLTSVAQVLAQSNPTSTATAALQTLASAASKGGSFNVGTLLNVGAFAGEDISSSAPATSLTAGVNAFQIAAASIALAQGRYAVEIAPATVAIPGLTSLSVTVDAGSPAQTIYTGAGVGSVGTSASSSQVSIAATLQLASTIALGPLASANVSINLPVTIALANGTAKLSGIACGTNPASDGTMTVTATTSAATIDASGTVSVTVTLAGATLASATANLDANVQVGSSGPTPVTFTQADVAAGTVHRVGSSDLVSTSVTSLDQSLNSEASNALSVSLAGVTVPGLGQALTPTILSTVSQLLQSLTQTLNPVVNGTAAALGVEVGYMDLTATGMRCGVPAVAL